MVDWSKPLQFRNIPSHTIVSAYVEPDGSYYIITRNRGGFNSIAKATYDGVIYTFNHDWDVINKVEKVKINLIFGVMEFPFIAKDNEVPRYCGSPVYPQAKLVTIEVELP